jgi:hypothetical protein
MGRRQTDHETGGVRERPPHEPPEKSEQKLDEALAETFPASDPPAQTQPIVHIGRSKPNL